GTAGRPGTGRVVRDDHDGGARPGGGRVRRPGVVAQSYRPGHRRCGCAGSVAGAGAADLADVCHAHRWRRRGRTAGGRRLLPVRSVARYGAPAGGGPSGRSRPGLHQRLSAPAHRQRSGSERRPDPGLDGARRPGLRTACSSYSPDRTEELTMPVIEARHLRKTYGTTVAVDDVSFAVEEGQIVAVLGPNGAGKTTTVELIAGLRQADSGAVNVLGRDPQGDPGSVRELVGMQLQEARLPAKIPAREAVHLYASFYSSPADPDQLLSQLGLAEKADTAFKDLSGGQQQRLSIALALVGRPRIAILDELTTGLDPHARREVWDLIESVRQSGVSILLVTHFMDEAERLADHVIIIDGGRVVASGTTAELTGELSQGYQFWMSFAHDLTEGELGSVQGLQEVTDLRGDDGGYLVTGTPEVLPAVIATLAAAGTIPTQVRTITHSLEDVFVQKTRDQNRPDLVQPSREEAHR